MDKFAHFFIFLSSQSLLNFFLILLNLLHTKTRKTFNPIIQITGLSFIGHHQNETAKAVATKTDRSGSKRLNRCGYSTACAIKWAFQIHAFATYAGKISEGGLIHEFDKKFLGIILRLGGLR